MLKSVLSRNTAQNNTNEAFNCSVDEQSAQLTFRVLRQIVKLHSIDFKEKSFHVHTELQILPVFFDITDIVLDLGPDCILPNETGYVGNGQVTINGVDAVYVRNRFKVSFDSNDRDRSVLHLKKGFKQAHSKYAGDLIICVPKKLVQPKQTTVLEVSIDCFVKQSKQGVIFSGIFGEPGFHFYTARSSLFSSTKHWLPCAENSSQLSVWRFEMTIPSNFVAIACGDLVDTVTDENTSMKTYYFQLLTPTSTVNIGFAIGDFQAYTQPDIPEIISYCLPGLMPLVKHTVSTLNRTFTFFEEVLSCRFPYGSYRLVFVDQLPEDMMSFSGLSIFSLHMLYHKRIFDLVQISRQHLAHAISQQFFGCFVNPTDFNEFWVMKALSRYISGLFVERFFGQSEHSFDTDKMLKSICDYEYKYGRIVLSTSRVCGIAYNAGHQTRPSGESLLDDTTYFDATVSDLCSPMYADALYKKGHFIMIMLQKRLGKEMFLKVLNRILNVATQFSQVLTKPTDWCHMLVSTDSFFRTITNLTGRELPSFIEQWIHTGGHVRFEINHTFNRKQNKLELEIKQSALSVAGVQNYVGPLTIVIQELDGSFSHTVQVDATISKHDILCHSKGRKQKKKRVPLSTGEEVEIDLTQMDADSPVMWIRIDPEMLILRQIVLNQQIHQWDYMLRYERDVNAQMQAIVQLRNFPVHQTQNVLMETLENDKFFYKVRRSAAHCLVDICNRLPDGLIATQHPLITYFQRCYGCKSVPSIPAPNNFVATAAHLQHYFLMLDLPLAIGKVRGQVGLHCPPAVLDFLLSLLKLNDNTSNRYSDDYYRGNLISALGSTLVFSDHETRTPDRITEDARSVITEAVHALNMDTMRPSFGRIVTINALYVLRNLQRLKHLPLDMDVFWKFASSTGVFSQVRRAALTCIISSAQNARNYVFSASLLRIIKEVILGDKDPYIRLKIAEQMCMQPPFVGMLDPAQTIIFPTNTPELADLLWKAISDANVECKVRTTLVDLYYQLYGTGTPLILRSGTPLNHNNHNNFHQQPPVISLTNGVSHNNSNNHINSMFHSSLTMGSVMRGAPPSQVHRGTAIYSAGHERTMSIM